MVASVDGFLRRGEKIENAIIPYACHWDPRSCLREAVHIAEGPFGASFERAPDGPYYRVKVTVLDEQIDDEARGVNGRLVIVSNDRTEPPKEIPLFGLGRVNRATPLDP